MLHVVVVQQALQVAAEQLATSKSCISAATQAYLFRSIYKREAGEVQYPVQWPYKAPLERPEPGSHSPAVTPR